MACDDAAVAVSTVSAVAYTEHLLYVAQSVTMSNRMQPAHLAVSAAYQALRRRIEYQLCRRAIRRQSVVKRWVVIAVLIVAVLPLSWDLTPWRRVEAAAKGDAFEAVPKSRYQPLVPQQPILDYGSGGCL